MAEDAAHRRQPGDMQSMARLGAVAEKLRGSMWLLPALSVVAAIAAGAGLSTVELSDDSPLRSVLFPGGPEGARAVLQAFATSVITVTSLVFTLTIIALQLASTQFSPRLLRTFLRLPANQIVLSTFIATFVYSLVVLRGVRSAQPAFVPELAVTVAFVLVLMSVAALVFFIHHITTEMRIDTLMWRVQGDTLDTIDRVHPDEPDGAPLPRPPARPDEAFAVPSQGSGTVQAVAADALLGVACERDLTIVLACHIGDHVVTEGTLAWAWPTDGTAAHGDFPSLVDDVNAGVTIGQERTMQQDISYGVRQLVDIAVKAMSPGVNDPTTAVDAVGHLAAILTRLARRELKPLLLRDDRGITRFVVDRPPFGHYMARSIDQIRRYAAAEPDVLLALLDLCREVAEAVDEDEKRATVQRHVDLVAAAAKRSVEEPEDLRRVLEAAARVGAVVRGARPPEIAAVRGDA